ncbi:thioredoxin domain-containing protein [Kitasatospora sp. GP82]|uniref:DsbA family protein n=1 Tax=Kitasatospora sp. GP82 TaxID=3035089 RepID=UPI0024766733|nr:thioredoxin domain-containing protein [Kitasatospora sp. GP82]MDH6124751.1 protein-disulfide isomerase [Kitasatospora sp. GP82]
MTSQHPSKPSPRERLREAQLREARAAAVRRRVVVGASIVGVLALAGATTLAISTADNGSGTGSSDSAKTLSVSTALVTPANTAGQNGTVVVYGKADAPHTLQVYEDFRCPICKHFEGSAGPAVQQLADSGTYKIEYHLAAFLDDNLGGQGSKNALAAVGAALDEGGVAKFKQLHDVLYANQPDERVDGFGNVNRILDLASQVPGLKTDAFTKAVTEGTYRPWASKVATAFNSSGVTGTPTVKLDGKALELFDPKGTPLTGEQFTALVQQTIGG